MAITLLDSVQHWKRKLDKDPGDDYIQNALRKLSKVPMTLEILEETHIGRTIRNLSKRDDIVGEKAKILLNQWRQMAFTANGKKENVNKDSKSSSKYTSREKTVHSQKQTSYGHLKNNSMSPSLSEESSKTYVNGNCKANKSTESSHSLHKYDNKERNSKYLDYDPHTETSTGYNPECPELFPSDKPVKTKKPVLVETYEPSSVKHETYEPSPVKHETFKQSSVKHETYEPSAVKRKLTDEKEQKEDQSHHKKFKSNSHSNSENVFNSAESKKSSEKKEKHKEKTKENSHCSSLKKESSKVKLHSENPKKIELASDAKKIKNEESSESDNTKSKKPKVKIHSAEEFTSSEVSFEDCLGFNDIVTLKKNPKSNSSKKTSSNTSPKSKPIEKIKKDLQETLSLDQRAKVSKESSSHGNKEKVSKESSSHGNKDKVSKESSSHGNKEKASKESSSHRSKEKISKESSSHSNKEKVSKHSSSNNKSKVSKHSHHSHKEVPFTVPKPSTKLDVADITSTLPEIQPNYRPLPRSPDFYAPKKKEVMSNEDAIKFTTSRREKTAVYSGRKNASCYTEVPSLLYLATKVLIENIDAIECVGDATYDLMKPVLDRCSPSQLYDIENYNPKFIEDTNDLWQAHCRRDFKLMTPMEHETWRELYWRAHDERERKLESVKKNISKSISTSTPVRQVKLAYVDSYVKPPRDVARKQAKHGTAAAVNHVVKPSSSTKPGSPSKPVPKPSAPAPSSSSSSSNSFSHTVKQKPKVAPLMAKTLKSLKAFRRK